MTNIECFRFSAVHLQKNIFRCIAHTVNLVCITGLIWYTYVFLPILSSVNILSFGRRSPKLKPNTHRYLKIHAFSEGQASNDFSFIGQVCLMMGLPRWFSCKRTHLPMQETWVEILGSRRFPGVRNGNPLQYSCLENLMDRGAWWAAAHRVTKSWTRLSLCVFCDINLLSPAKCGLQQETNSRLPRSVCIGHMV